MKYEKQFRTAYPETVGEKDSSFDMSNYADFLEERVERLESAVKVAVNCKGIDNIIHHYPEVSRQLSDSLIPS